MSASENALELHGCSFANNTAVNATRDVFVDGDRSLVVVYGWPQGYTGSASGIELNTHGVIHGDALSYSPPILVRVCASACSPGSLSL